jgi:hypothetical protein
MITVVQRIPANSLKPGTVVLVVTGGEGALAANKKIGIVNEVPKKKPKKYEGEMFNKLKLFIESEGKFYGLGAGCRVEVIEIVNENIQ